MKTSDIYLEHALLAVRNKDESLGFYQKLLPDWVVRWEGKTMNGGRWVHYGPKGQTRPSYLSIAEYKEKLPTSGRIRHVGFAHGDVKGLVERLRKEGIEPSDEAEDEKYVRAYYEDPDGNEIEFVEQRS